MSALTSETTGNYDGWNPPGLYCRLMIAPPRLCNYPFIQEEHLKGRKVRLQHGINSFLYCPSYIRDRASDDAALPFYRDYVLIKNRTNLRWRRVVFWSYLRFEEALSPSKTHRHLRKLGDIHLFMSNIGLSDPFLDNSFNETEVDVVYDSLVEVEPYKRLPHTNKLDHHGGRILYEPNTGWSSFDAGSRGNFYVLDILQPENYLPNPGWFEIHRSLRDVRIRVAPVPPRALPCQDNIYHDEA